VPVELLELWTICMYIANWQIIDLFLGRKTLLPTSSSVASCVDCNDIRFQDGKRFIHLGPSLCIPREFSNSNHCVSSSISWDKLLLWLAPSVFALQKPGFRFYQMMCNLWLKFQVNYWVLGGHHIFPITFDSGFICSWKTIPFAICNKYLELLLNKIHTQLIFVNKLSIVFRLLDMDQDCLSPTCDWWFWIGVAVQMLPTYCLCYMDTQESFAWGTHSNSTFLPPSLTLGITHHIYGCGHLQAQHW
jgi:hypothetical protein